MEVAEAGAETATLQNGKVEQQVTIEDCPEAGDVDTTVTIKLTKQPAAAVTAASDDASDEEVEEEIIEVVEGDADGDTVEVTETVQVVKQEEVAAPKTTTTVTVIKKQDGSVGDANTTTTTTTTTVVRKASVAESAPDATATADEPTNTQTTTTVKKTITTTAATPTPTPTQTSAAVIVKKEVVVDPPKQQQAAEVVQEVEEEEEEEEEVEDEEEEEAEDAKDDGDVVAKTNGSSIPTTKSQNEAEPATAPAAAPEAPSEKEAVAAPVTAVAAPVDAARQEHEQQKQDNLNNTIKEIISDLDRDIEQQEDVAKLKAQQMELLKQQQALAQQIRQQQLLSQQLAAQNKLQEQQLQQQQHYQPQQATKAAPAALAAPGTVSKSTTIEESQHENGFTRKNESYEVEEKDGLLTTRLTKSTVQESHTSGGMPPMAGIPAARPAFFDRYCTPTAATAMPYQHSWQNTSNSSHVEESSNVSKRIDLQKIFTPATDAEEILPKNRKLYASSAFYSPSLHPTVEDQVELARRISHSLSDISNHQSKGQSMYVNRKKRSVKWVHEGAGKAKKDTSLLDYECEETSKENTDIYNNDVSTATTSTTSTTTSTGQLPLTKVPLKLVMNPRGQIRDFNSVRESLNTETGLMSPDKCAELVTALNTQKGKGAELFAKRRRKAEKWVVDETNAGTQSPSGLPDYHQYQPRPPTSPSIVPAYSDAGKHRVQLNMHQEQMLEKYAKPGLKVVKTPWEAALETGSASAAFVEEHKLSPYSNQATPTISPAPAPLYLDNRAPSPYPAVSSTDAGSYADFAPQPYQQQTKLPQTQYQPSKPTAYNSQRDLAYKPNIAQGWKAPSMTLPKAFGYALNLDFHSLAQDCQTQQQEQHQQQQQQQQLEFQQQQQQQQISDAAKNCEAQTNKDEEELICYMERAKLVPPAAIHDFGNHLVRSPELLVSPIPRKNLLLYDNAMHEFQETLDKQQHHEKTNKQQQQHVTDNHKETHDVVDVAKQLQQFKEYQQYVAMQQLQEEQLLKQRKARQRERENELQYQREWRKQQAQQQQQPLQPQPCTAAQLEQIKDEQPQQQQEENYVKVAVRDLITTFEQQSAAEAKQIEKEQQKLQEWKVRQQQAPDKTRAADRQQQQLHYKQQHVPSQQQQQQQVLQQKQTKQMSYEEFLRGKEAQARQQTEKQQQQIDNNSRIPTEISNSSSSNEMMPAANDIQELYVPKEIPLESYAPPPAVSPTIYNKPSAPITDSYNWSPTQAAYEPSSYPATVSATTQQYPSSYPSYSSAPQAKPQSSFPLSKNSAVGGIGGGYSSTYAPPKQPHLPPNSYQTVQQLTGQAPQVSFNPSPLPYDKLAKFENPPPPEISSPRNLYSPYRALGVSGAGSRVRNVSPSPYGARPTSGASQVYPPALSPQAAAYGNGAAGAASPNYGTPGSSRPPSQQFSSYGATQGYENGSSCSNYRPSTADLAHCQNFNNAARGWGSGRTGTGSSQNGAGYRNTKSVAAAGLLPYSDF